VSYHSNNKDTRQRSTTTEPLKQSQKTSDQSEMSVPNSYYQNCTLNISKQIWLVDVPY